MNHYDDVQAAAIRRAMAKGPQLDTTLLATQIVNMSEGNNRVAYDFLDALNKKVTEELLRRSR